MSTELTEQEMREALGLDTIAPPAPEPELVFDEPPPAPKPVALPPPPPPVIAAPKPKKRPTSGLRVTLRVSLEFEGDEVIFVHEVNTLSRFDAEQLARKAATKEKYRYIELVSIAAIV